MIIKKRHRILGIIISAVMVFAMVPVTAMAAYDYSLRIGDSGSIQETCSGDGWSWDEESRTLTLEGFDLSSERNTGIILLQQS